MIIIGFGAGIGAVRFFFEFTEQDTIPKNEKIQLKNIANNYERIKQENQDLKKKLEKEDLTASITIPKEGDKAIGRIDVQGKTSRQLTENEHLWLVLHHQPSIAWEPQVSEIVLNNDNTWESIALIGEESENIGHKFELVIVLADDSENEEFNQYLLEIKRTGKWKAKTLPSGVIKKYKVTVVRK